jgi:hypothetical protein
MLLHTNSVSIAIFIIQWLTFVRVQGYDGYDDPMVVLATVPGYPAAVRVRKHQETEPDK